MLDAYPLRFKLQGVAVASLFPVIHSVFCCASAASYVTTYETYPQVLYDEKCCYAARSKSKNCACNE